MAQRASAARTDWNLDIPAGCAPPPPRAQEAAAELEELGFGALWFGEAMGRESLTNAGFALGRERSESSSPPALRISTAGMAVTLAAAAEKNLGRGLPKSIFYSVSVSVTFHWSRSCAAIVTISRFPPWRAYLDAMDQAPYQGRTTTVEAPAESWRRFGPKMLQLSAERADRRAIPTTPRQSTPAPSSRTAGPLVPYLCPEQGRGPGDRSGQGEGYRPGNFLAILPDFAQLHE